VSEITITVPIPHRATHPNSRPHYMAKANHAKKQRMDAKMAALARAMTQDFKAIPNVKHEVKSKFYFPTSRNRDRDNLISWLKSTFDGIADAKIVENDCLLVSHSVDIDKDKTNPRVEITIRPLQSA
jgi:Holliday junction resolvase RusA-like endonuclease